jgi:hypothetical protein
MDGSFIISSSIDLNCFNLNKQSFKPQEVVNLFDSSYKQKSIFQSVQNVKIAKLSEINCLLSKSKNIRSKNKQAVRSDLALLNVESENHNIFGLSYKSIVKPSRIANSIDAFASPQTDGALEMESINLLQDTREMEWNPIWPLPGKGKKFLFNSTINDKFINILIDTGSSTSLVSKSLISILNIPYYTSRLPVNFLGMFGDKLVSNAKIANIAIDIGTSKKLALPAYIMENLPNGVDVLIGMDQIGNTLGVSIDLFNNSFISIFDSYNLIYKFKLSEGNSLVQTGIPSNNQPCSKLSTSSDEVESRLLEKPIESSLYSSNSINIYEIEMTMDREKPSNDEVGSSMTEKPFEKLNTLPISKTQTKEYFNPNLLSFRIEMENISSALTLLRHELERLISNRITSPVNI